MSHTSPDIETWRSKLARAAAGRDVAAAGFLTTLAELAEAIPQRELASALGTSQANISRWATRGREQAQRRDGRLGADPYEIAQRYALGQIPRDQAITALAQWPYAQDFVPSSYWDDAGVSPKDGFRRTVGRALRDGLLSAEDYDEIVDALPH